SHNCGIVLQRAVDHQIRAFFLCNTGRFTHFLYVATCTRGAGGVGEHRDAWFDTEGNRGDRGLDCDFSQLLCGWIRVDRTVAVNVNLFRQQHEEHGGNQRATWSRFDQLQRWTDGVRGSVNRTGYQAVNFVLLQHQRTQHHVVFQLLTRNGFGHAFVLTQFDQTGNVAFANHFWINDFDASTQLNALGCRNAVNLIRVTQQHTGRDAALCTDSCRFHGTWFVAFWQNNSFARFTRQLGQLVTEGRRRQTTAALGGCGQGFDPVCVDVACNVFLNFLDTLVVTNRHFQVEALQAQGGLPGVGVDHEYRQASRERAFAQLADAWIHLVSTGQQDSADFYAIHRGQAGSNQHVWTVCGG